MSSVNVAGSASSVVSNNLYWLFAEVVAILEPGDRSVAADLLPSVPSAGIDSTREYYAPPLGHDRVLNLVWQPNLGSALVLLHFSFLGCGN